ncbi:hypothetical protein JVU11DRAFT_4583 [Chiua virens]|nr:hypothetical protein JVU11DRAFT_4583 [Chiua virens]
MTGNGSPSSWNSGHVPANSLTEGASSREATAHGQPDIATTSAAGRSGISNVAASHQGTPSFSVLDASSQHFDDAPYVPPRITQAELSAYPALDPRVVTFTTYPPSNQHVVSLTAPPQQYPYDNVTSPLDSIETWSASSSSSATSQDYLANKFSHAPLPQRQPGYYPAYEGQHRHGLGHIKYGDYPSNTGGSYYRSPPQGPSMISPEIFDAQFYYPATSSQASTSSSINRPHPLSTSSASPGPLVDDVFMSADPTGTYLRQQLGIQAHEPISLWSIPEPPTGEKPSTPLPMLVKLAIYGSPKKQLTLQEIYTELENRFQWYRDHKQDTAWKNSIRHNLSLNKVFVHVPRPITEPGKGNYWRLDVSGGEGYKRARKRRPKNKHVVSEEEEEDTSEMDEERPGSSHRSESRSTPVEDANIDPELREGHVVGVRRTRSSTRRAGAGGGSPYPQHSPRYQQGPLPPITGGQETDVPGQPSIRFGQPSFGQMTFPAFGQDGATTAVASSPSTSTPFATTGSASASMAMAMAQTIPAASRVQVQPAVSSSYDRNMQVALQPTQRPGIECVTDLGDLPTPRCVGTTFSPNSREQSPGNSSGASPGSISSGSSRTWNDAGSRSRAQG